VTIRVQKVGDVIEQRVALTGQRAGDVAAVLSRHQPAADPRPDANWQLDLMIGDGDGRRRIPIDLPPLLSRSHDLGRPTLLGETQSGETVVYFRNRLFISDRAPLNDTEYEELELRVKKAIYDEDAGIAALRAAVANIEAVIEYQRSGPKREPIPEDVKLLVWTRDGGTCVGCGSNSDLHFDHIIPVVKGGGNTSANIQILCQRCNLRKSDKIAVL
jgi:hypothetical protein